MRVVAVAEGRKYRLCAELSLSGRCRVIEEIDKLKRSQPTLAQKMAARLRDVADNGYEYHGEQICRHLGDGVFELKIPGRPALRLFCFVIPGTNNIILIDSIWLKGNQKEQQSKIAGVKSYLKRLRNETPIVEFN